MGEGAAEIALEEVLEENEVLLPHRPVEPEIGDDLVHAGLRAFGRGEDVDRVPDHVDAEEHQHRHHEQDEDRLQDASEDELGHRLFASPVLSARHSTRVTSMASVRSFVRGLCSRSAIIAHLFTWKWMGMSA